MEAVSRECITHHFACDCRERKFADVERENAALRDAAVIIRNALEEYNLDGVNGNEYRLINTVRRAIAATRKEAQP